MTFRPFGIAAIVLTIALGTVGCDWTEMRPVEEQVVVESYLLAGGPLPSVRLTRTADIASLYAPEVRAVRDATVRIQRVTDLDSVAASYPYRMSTIESGVYVPANQDQILPGSRYRLVVELPDGQVVSSTTTVPDTLSLLSASADTAVYDREQVELTLTRSIHPARTAYVVFTSEALDASEENMTEITRRLLEQAEDLTLDEIRVTSSPALSEDTYLDAGKDLLVIPVPWLGIRFYGRYLIRVSAVDDNLYDFLRSQMVQQGGSTFLPGEVPNILDRIDGGTGIFGSYASASTVIYVERPPH